MRDISLILNQNVLTTSSQDADEQDGGKMTDNVAPAAEGDATAHGAGEGEGEGEVSAVTE